jgi:hypothetical protein
MTEEVMEDSSDEQLEKLKALEFHAWECFKEVQHKDDAFKDRLAALKMVADLVLAQLRYRKDTQPREETESVEFYMEQLRSLRERVEQLAKRRRAL